MSKESWSTDDFWRAMNAYPSYAEQERQKAAAEAERVANERRQRELLKEQRLADQRRQEEQQAERVYGALRSRLQTVLQALYERDPEVRAARYKKLDGLSLFWGNVLPGDSRPQQLLEKYHLDHKWLEKEVPDHIILEDYYELRFQINGRTFVIRNHPFEEETCPPSTSDTVTLLCHEGYVKLGSISELENEMRLVTALQGLLKGHHRYESATKGRNYWYHEETDKERKAREKSEQKEAKREQKEREEREERQRNSPDYIY